MRRSASKRLSRAGSALRLRPQRRAAFGDRLIDDLQVLLKHRRCLRVDAPGIWSGGGLVEPRCLFELRDRVLVVLLGEPELGFHAFDGDIGCARCPAAAPPR